jgi:ABC-type branched-subunit amino acid transport system permease subunit
LLENEVWGNFLGYNLMILGGILIVIVLFMPRGVVTFGRDRVRDVAVLFRR